MMSYDQGYWHTDECENKGIKEKYAATHIALYVKWCAVNDMMAPEFYKGFEKAIENLIVEKLTATEFFEKYCDWKFGEWNLNKKGNDFTKCYYEFYLTELSEILPCVVYGDESKIAFTKYSEILDLRYSEYVNLGPSGVPWTKRKRPWWHFFKL